MLAGNIALGRSILGALGFRNFLVYGSVVLVRKRSYYIIRMLHEEVIGVERDFGERWHNKDRHKIRYPLLHLFYHRADRQCPWNAFDHV